MCKSCASALILLACMAMTDAFFLPIFYRKAETQSPAVTSNNVGWGRAPGGHAPQTTFKDYPAYGPTSSMQAQVQQMQTAMPMAPLQPVPMASMQQFTYETPSMVMSYHQPQPQFHNVQLVPCMCPITREVIEQQSQNLMQQAAVQSSTEVKPVSPQPNKSS